HRSAVQVHDLAAADLVVQLADAVHSDLVIADAERRLFGHLDFGDERAGRRIPAGKIDAGCLANATASAVAADEILRAHRSSIRQTYVDARVVLPEARHLASAIDRHSQLAEPLDEDALDMGLPQPQGVWMARGKITEVEADHLEADDLHRLSLRDESLGDAALIEDFDRACVQAAGARAGEILAGASLDDCDVDAGEGELAGQCHSCRSASGDQYCVVSHPTCLH